MRISPTGIEVLNEPTVNYCPLHESLYGSKHIDVEAVQKSVEKKVSEYGFCCRNRLFNAEPIVAYGASEMLQVWLEKGLVDCAVIVCEGAGTVITANGELVQAIGARLTGIVKTSPIQEIIEHIESNGGTVLEKSSARIDQAEGVKQAVGSGFKRVAVTVASSSARAISEIRQFEADTGLDVLVFSVCNTRAGDADVQHINKADIACASASSILRTKVGNKALIQLGVTIPVYALTEKGKRLILAYLAESDHKLVVFRTKALPYQPEGKGPTLKNQSKHKRP
ncbi:DUF2099 family protein [Candidatus Bathyarchaeota archaeon]|nr:DUF2099 family protein [Candidatus Bathyarchaeota archaeon]